MIKGERINLRPIEQKDMDMLRSWRNRYSDSFGDGGIITKEQQRKFYDRYQESQTDRMFVVELKDGTPIGSIALYNISSPDRTADVGRVILIEEYRGHGYAEEAVKMVVKLADDMRLYKTRVWAFLDNMDAISIYARAGFKAGRPRIYMERVNDINWKAPLTVESYDESSGEGGYESQCLSVS